MSICHFDCYKGIKVVEPNIVSPRLHRHVPYVSINMYQPMAQDSPNFANFILEQLQRLDGVRSRPMFGSYGLYLGSTFFAVVSDDRLYFKTNASTLAKYLDAGMNYFQPSSDQALKRYYEVPAEIIEQPEVLAEWAIEAASI